MRTGPHRSTLLVAESPQQLEELFVRAGFHEFPSDDWLCRPLPDHYYFGRIQSGWRFWMPGDPGYGDRAPQPAHVTVHYAAAQDATELSVRQAITTGSTLAVLGLIALCSGVVAAVAPAPIEYLATHGMICTLLFALASICRRSVAARLDHVVLQRVSEVLTPLALSTSPGARTYRAEVGHDFA